MRRVLAALAILAIAAGDAEAQYVSGPGVALGAGGGGGSAGSGIVAGGGGQAGGTVLTNSVNFVATVLPGSGVVSPVPAAGSVLFVFNQGTNVLTVYPAVGVSIDGMTANSPVQVPPGSNVVLIGQSTTAQSSEP